MNNWRREAQKAKTFDPALSDRLLKALLDCLRSELLVRRTYNFTIISKGFGDEFWSERENDFLRFTEEVYAENKRNGRIVCNVADYLSEGLHRFDRAIEVFQAANDEHLLDEGGQAKLVGYLHSQNRIGESIGVLQSLVEAHPDNPEYRRLLMYSYFRTNRRDDLLGLLKQCDDYFHQKDRWGEGLRCPCSPGACLQDQLFEQSVKYYKELIPLHERTAANRGIGDGILSGYYGGQAQALAGLKRMPEAVEAACGAIISWGANVKNRAHAWRPCGTSCEAARANSTPSSPNSTFRPPRPAKTTLTSIKPLGQVYMQRGQYGNAVVQLCGLRVAAQRRGDLPVARRLLRHAERQAGRHSGTARPRCNFHGGTSNSTRSWRAPLGIARRPRGGTGLHFDCRSARRRVRKPRHAGRGPRAPEPLDRGD